MAQGDCVYRGNCETLRKNGYCPRNCSNFLSYYNRMGTPKEVYRGRVDIRTGRRNGMRKDEN